MRFLLTLTFFLSAAVQAQSFRHEDGSIECAPGWTARGSGCSLTAENLERGQSDEARDWCPRGWTRQGGGCSLSAEGQEGSPEQDPRSGQPDPRSERPDPRGEQEIDFVEACAGASFSRGRMGPGASFDPTHPCNRRSPPPPPRR
jgi:hypothetical protein